ncbi:hypothetical protein KCV03_g57, partial [Aureobasidium melanogenum]
MLGLDGLGGTRVDWEATEACCFALGVGGSSSSCWPGIARPHAVVMANDMSLGLVVCRFVMALGGRVARGLGNMRRCARLPWYWRLRYEYGRQGPWLLIARGLATNGGMQCDSVQRYALVMTAWTTRPPLSNEKTSMRLCSTRFIQRHAHADMWSPPQPLWSAYQLSHFKTTPDFTDTHRSLATPRYMLVPPFLLVLSCHHSFSPLQTLQSHKAAHLHIR